MLSFFGITVIAIIIFFCLIPFFLIDVSGGLKFGEIWRFEIPFS